MALPPTLASMKRHVDNRQSPLILVQHQDYEQASGNLGSEPPAGGVSARMAADKLQSLDGMLQEG